MSGPRRIPGRGARRTDPAPEPDPGPAPNAAGRAPLPGSLAPPRRWAAQGLTLSAATAQDQAFLRALYADVRADEVASHSHGLMLYSGGADLSGTPVVGAALTPPGSTRCYVANPTYDTMLSPMAIAPSMGGQPHNNVQPVLAMTYAIALAGVYPSFS